MLKHKLLLPWLQPRRSLCTLNTRYRAASTCCSCPAGVANIAPPGGAAAAAPASAGSPASVAGGVAVAAFTGRQSTGAAAAAAASSTLSLPPPCRAAMGVHSSPSFDAAPAGVADAPAASCTAATNPTGWLVMPPTGTQLIGCAAPAAPPAACLLLAAMPAPLPLRNTLPPPPPPAAAAAPAAPTTVGGCTSIASCLGGQGLAAPCPNSSGVSGSVSCKPLRLNEASSATGLPLKNLLGVANTGCGTFVPIPVALPRVPASPSVATGLPAKNLLGVIRPTGGSSRCVWCSPAAVAEGSTTAGTRPAAAASRATAAAAGTATGETRAAVSWSCWWTPQRAACRCGSSHMLSRNRFCALPNSFAVSSSSCTPACSSSCAQVILRPRETAPGDSRLIGSCSGIKPATAEPGDSPAAAASPPSTAASSEPAAGWRSIGGMRGMLRCRRCCCGWSRAPSCCCCSPVGACLSCWSCCCCGSCCSSSFGCFLACICLATRAFKASGWML
ncbi:hypothetical protein COO60DRAFT_757083 [Scenedesmus sp. NREL 46B-D3]|nr:hypothetical protein COO60DRAFT_757083 [Scenedesmus sp. NREL 46B-D3]